MIHTVAYYRQTKEAANNKFILGGHVESLTPTKMSENIFHILSFQNIRNSFFPTETLHFLTFISGQKGFAHPLLADMSSKNVVLVGTPPLRFIDL